MPCHQRCACVLPGPSARHQCYTSPSTNWRPAARIKCSLDNVGGSQQAPYRPGWSRNPKLHSTDKSRNGPRCDKRSSDKSQPFNMMSIDRSGVLTSLSGYLPVVANVVQHRVEDRLADSALSASCPPLISASPKYGEAASMAVWSARIATRTNGAGELAVAKAAGSARQPLRPMNSRRSAVQLV